MWGLQPFRLYKKLLETTQFCIIKVKYHVGLVDDRGVDLSETIVDPRGAGVIVGAHGGDQINGLAGRGLRADQFIVFMGRRAEFQMGQEQMLIEIARGHGVLGVVPVKKRFPLLNCTGIARFRCGQYLLQPARNEIEFFLLEWRKPERHAAVRVFFKIPSEFFLVFGTGQIVGFRPVLPDAFRVFHLVGKQLDHDRVVQPA